MKDIAKILKIELERRRKANPAYSLRAFARGLEISPAALSQLISGKRGLSVKRLDSILDKLGLVTEEPSRKLSALAKRRSEAASQKMLKDDQFRLINEWFHYAILSLGELPESSADPRWIAQRLGIRPSDANDALSRLRRLGLIKIQSGKFQQISGALRTADDVPSSSVRRYHRAILSLAQLRIEEVAVDKREYTATTMAISTKNLPRAKKMIRAFKRDLNDLLEDGRPDEVYQLAIQLFPLTREGSK